MEKKKRTGAERTYFKQVTVQKHMNVIACSQQTLSQFIQYVKENEQFDKWEKKVLIGEATALYEVPAPIRQILMSVRRNTVVETIALLREVGYEIVETRESKLAKMNI